MINSKFSKHITCVTYDRNKKSWYILKILDGSRHSIDGTTYLAKTVSYTGKMFMTLTTECAQLVPTTVVLSRGSFAVLSKLEELQVAIIVL